VEVEFESVPEGADVFVDGTEVCRNTPCKARLGLGKHKIFMQARWYQRGEAQADVQKDTTIKIELKKQPHKKEVLVVFSKDFALYRKAVKGFKEVFKGSIEEVVLKGALAKPGEFQKRVLRVNPKVILALGLRAAKIAKARIRDVPIVFCMAMHPIMNGLRSGTSTGVHLEPSVAEQLKAVGRMLPHIKRIGIIYDPARTGGLVAQFRDAAAEQKKEIVAVAVKNRAEAKKALMEMSGKAQALWLIRDATVLTRQFFNHSLVVQLEKKMPVIAYSQQFVKKGAFISYSADYPRQGRKAAEIVRAILAGKAPSELEVAYPDGALTVNLNTAKKIQYIMPGVQVLEEVDMGVIVFQDFLEEDQK
jgi:putative ABC transport system substrate-binding protein